MIKEIIAKHVSITEFASIMKMSRNNLYKSMRDYENNKLNSRDRTVVWAFDTLFKEELSYDEFEDRLYQVRKKMAVNNDYTIRSNNECFEISPNTFITKNYVKKFSYELIDSLTFKLTINDEENYALKERQLLSFLKMYNL